MASSEDLPGVRFRAPGSSKICWFTERKQITNLLYEVNTALLNFVTGNVLLAGTFAGRIAGHGSRFAVNFTAALPAKVAIIFLGSRHQPKTTTRLAQDGGTQQPFVKSDLIFYPHRPPCSLLCRVFRALGVLNDKRRDSFNKVWRLFGDDSRNKP